MLPTLYIYHNFTQQGQRLISVSVMLQGCNCAPFNFRLYKLSKITVIADPVSTSMYILTPFHHHLICFHILAFSPYNVQSHISLLFSQISLWLRFTSYSLLVHELDIQAASSLSWAGRIIAHRPPLLLHAGVSALASAGSFLMSILSTSTTLALFEVAAPWSMSFS